MKLINYYPAAAAQQNFWSNWDAAQIDRDFSVMAALGADTVRVAMWPAVIGWPIVSPLMLSRWYALVGIAQRHGLALKPALYAGWGKTCFGDPATSAAWASQLLAPYPACKSVLAAIDLYNEIDPQSAQAMELLANVAPAVRRIVGTIPLTASVAVGTDQLAVFWSQAKAVLDFAEWHYYGPAESAYAHLAAAVEAVQYARLLIGETGYSTARAVYTPAWWEAYQDKYLRTVQAACQALDLEPAGPWCYSDFTPSAFPQAEPAPEYAYGLYRTDGTAKPAASSCENGEIDLGFNGDLSAGDSAGNPFYWQPWEAYYATFGWRSNQLGIAQSAPGSPSPPAWYTSPVEPVVAGQNYKAACVAAGTLATGDTRLKLAWFDIAGKFLSADSSQPLPVGTSGPVSMKVHAQAPAGAASVQIHLASANNSGRVAFGNVSFQRVAS